MGVSVANRMRYFRDLLFYPWRSRDSLTGAFDVHKLQSDLRVALQHSQQIAYILADLDEFKRVNDKCGHNIGDRVLRGVGNGFADKCDGNPSCLGPYRRGGASFSVILTNVDAESAMQFAESLRVVVEQIRIEGYSDLNVTARLAVVTAPVRAHDSGELERCQDGLQVAAEKVVYCHPGNRKRNGIVQVAIEEQVNRTGRWSRTYVRGNEEKPPDNVRVCDEIMQFLVKRETSLADALDALTTLLLHQLSAKYGKSQAFFRFYEQVSKFLGPTERDLAVGSIPKKQPGGLAAKVQPSTVTMVERPEGILRLATGVGELITECGPIRLEDALNAITGTMLTAIEAACGRERADEFDLLLRRFSTETQAGGRVQ